MSHGKEFKPELPYNYLLYSPVFGLPVSIFNTIPVNWIQFQFYHLWVSRPIMNNLQYCTQPYSQAHTNHVDQSLHLKCA